MTSYFGKVLERLLVLTLLAPVCVAAPSPSHLPATHTATDVSQQAPDLLDEVRALLKQKQFDQAEQRGREILHETERAHGPDSLEVARVLDLVVESLWRARRAKNPDARAFAERAATIKKQRLGKWNLDVAESLTNLAIVLEYTGKDDEAIATYESAIEIRLKATGPSSPEYAAGLTSLASFHLAKDECKEARPLYERALVIQEQALGPDSPVVAKTLTNLANLLERTGQYAASESRYRQALEIKERAVERDEHGIAWTANGLALLLEQVGDYEGAREQYERVLAIREKHLEQDHIHVAWVLNNLAGLLRDTGEYAEARTLYEKALSIQEKKVGRDHVDFAVAENNLAELLYLTGDYVEAMHHQRHVLDVREKAYGADDPRVARTLYKIALILLKQGDYAGARSRFQRALDIYRESRGVEHPEYAWTLSALARLCAEEGKNDEALSLAREALALRQKVLGDYHPHVAESAITVGQLLLRKGETAESRQHLERALSIRRRSLGEEHPLVAEVQNELAVVLAVVGEREAALDLALRAEEIANNHLSLTVRTLPDRQALRYASVRSGGLDLALSLVESKADETSRERVWDAVCRSRALILDEMAFRRQAVARSQDPELAELSDRLLKASRKLANLSVRGPAELDSQRYRGQLESVRREKEAAERALAMTSAKFPEEQASRRAGLAEVAQAMPPGVALAAYVSYRHQDLSSANVVPQSVRSYLAFILKSSDSEPELVPLGEAEVIDDLVSRWRRQAAAGALLHGRDTSEEKEQQYRVAGEALRRAIWDPLVPALGKTKRVFIVPDGALHLVSFAAMPTGRSEYLIETGPLLHYLSAERDAVTLVMRQATGRGLLAIGGVAFDDAAAVAAAELEEGNAVAVRSADPHTLESGPSRSSCDAMHTIRFGSLPASIHETRDIVGLWKLSSEEKEASQGDSTVINLHGPEASEAAFKKAAPGKRVLHLATHGFFLGDGCPSALDGSRGIGGLAPMKTTELPTIAGENPLLLSGLALAGANRRDTALSREEDGILTAEEIAAMDLCDVEWTVLSACDTAIGEVQAGEGVLGLRRAFQVAGSGSIIMSLWRVSDRMARNWMNGLYEARLIRGLGTSEAVHAASLTMLNRQRENGETSHPFYWAGFVAAGDWR